MCYSEEALALFPSLSLPAEDQAEALLSKRAHTCRDWALVANEYVALGEARAVARLKATPERDPFSPASVVPARKGLLCRILFSPEGAKGLRPPLFGGLGLSYHSMPPSSWPEYPFVRQDGVCFLLSEGYSLAGEPEPLARYLDLCRKDGAFKKSLLPVPPSAQAEQAPDRLQDSPRWKAIRWSYKGQGETYTMSPVYVLDPMKEQTRF